MTLTGRLVVVVTSGLGGFVVGGLCVGGLGGKCMLGGCVGAV